MMKLTIRIVSALSNLMVAFTALPAELSRSNVVFIAIDDLRISNLDRV